MSPHAFVRFVPFLVVAACATAPRSEPTPPVADASARRPVPDRVVAQLASGACAVHDVRRRVAVENLANVNTVGWKRRMVRASTRSIVGPDGTSHDVPVVLGVEPVFTPGSLLLTGRCLDLAIDGEGFFAMALADGSVGYTRAGSLRVDTNGRLASADGRIVLPQITLPDDVLELTIDPEGRVGCRTAGNPDTATLLGQLTLHRFANPGGLVVTGSCFRPSDASGAPRTGTPGTIGLGQVRQGWLEQSNVECATETLALQVVEREHEALRAALRELVP